MPNQRPLRFSLWLLPLLGLLLLAGCGDDDSGSTPEAGTLDKLFTYPQITGCGTCHGPGGEQSLGFDLSTKSKFRTELVNKNQSDYSEWQDSVTSNQVTEDCGDVAAPYVSPNTPGQSTLLEAITFEHGNRCSGTHSFHDPSNAMITNQALIEDLVLWIKNGANP